jgi:hypothetical protein
VLAIVFGHIALAEMTTHPHRTGRDMAIAGLVLGYLGVAVVLLHALWA